jgi:4-hydroxy-tetrahydrodipicolinate synthase
MHLHGVLIALVTPFDVNGNLDTPALERLIEYQLEQGASGFVPCGSTGEYYALSAEERAKVLECTIKTVGKRGLLIAGANAGSTRDVISHARTAKELGYDTILLAPPYYSLPSQEELIAHYQAVLNAVDVKLMLYDYPPRVGVQVGFAVLDAFKDNPRVIGIKESSGSLVRAIEIKQRYGDSYQLSCGADDQAFDFLLWGATSWICGPGNCFAKQCNTVMRAFERDDRVEAQKEMSRLFRAMASLESGKFVQKVKYGCELLGIPVGNARGPLLPLSEDEKRDFRRAFQAADQ